MTPKLDTVARKIRCQTNHYSKEDEWLILQYKGATAAKTITARLHYHIKT